MTHGVSDPVVSASLSVSVERWPIAGSFTIARGAKTEAVVVVVTLTGGNGVAGRGECVPYGRYAETVEGVTAGIEGQRAWLRAGADRASLARRMPPGAARNAIDCALFDLQAKLSGTPAWQMAGLPPPRARETAFTLSLGSPQSMAAAAHAARHRPLLKIKLGGPDDDAAIAAIRVAAPDSRLIVDANEGWTPENLAAHLRACHAAEVALIEQPLPAGRDQALAANRSPIPICADESLHVGTDLAALTGRYAAINIKLDKTGGLTEALALRAAAKAAGFQIMIGCMVATSLSMAPAMLLAADADFVDLDGPLLLARDREPTLAYEGSLAHPPRPELWG